MPSTFSNNYSIELITTGEQAGQWGDTTNRNYERFEQMAGGVATITIDDLPEGSLSTWDGSTFEWYTSDTAEAGEVNSEGRCKYVSFTSVGFIGSGPATVKIFGSDSVSSPTRVFIVSNNLVVSGSDKPGIVLRSGPSSTATVTLNNGKSALVYNDSVDVKNILDDLTFDSLDVGTLGANVLDFSGAASSGDAQIKIADGFSEALKFIAGSGNVISFDTSGSTNTVRFTGDVQSTADLQVDGDLTVVAGDTSTKDLDIDGDLSVTGDIVGGLIIREVVIVPTSTTGGMGVGEDTICSHTFNFTPRTGVSKVLIIGSVQLEADPNQTNTKSGSRVFSTCTVRMQRRYSVGDLTPLSALQQIQINAEAHLITVGPGTGGEHAQYTANYPILAYIDDVPGGGTAEFRMTGTQSSLAGMEWSNSGMILIDFGETP